MIRVQAPAKINLYLHVTGKRNDGYHLLDSLMAFAECGDVIEVEAANDLSLSISGPFGEGLPTGPDNLVMQAAEKLRQLAGGTKGARIKLQKNLPVASGIGGGSADAAAVLKALCQLWNVFPTENDLMALALSLGADVPICLTGKASFVSGIGEIITPVPTFPRVPMVLVNPAVAVATPSIFKARQGGFSDHSPFAEICKTANQLVEHIGLRSNDLMAPAIQIASIIEVVLEGLSGQDGILLSRMSGSGATCFGLFDNHQNAHQAARSLKSLYPGWWVERTELFG